VKNLKILILTSTETKISEYFYNSFSYLSSEFGKIYILNIKNIINKKLNKFSNKVKLKNYIYKDIKNKNELLAFLKEKDFIVINILNRSIKFHKIYRILKKAKVFNILISDDGYVAENKMFFRKKFIKSFTNLLFYKINYYSFRIFTILRIYPQIDLFLESSTSTIEKVNKGISKKIDKLVGFNLLSYYKKVLHINSRHKKTHITKNKNKKISFLETPINHPDRINREGKATKKDEYNYYNNLRKFLIYIQNIFKMKVIICAHPYSNINNLKKRLGNFKIEKYKTEKNITQSDIVLFHQSSSIIQAINERKKIINLQSNEMGDFLNYRNTVYEKYIDFVKINISKKYEFNKKEINKRLETKIQSYNTYIKNNIMSNINISHNDQINMEIKKYFNNL